MNQQIVLVRKPQALPMEADFRLETIDEPVGQGVLCATKFISVDPYLRGRLSGRHLTATISPGQAMDSELVVQILEDTETIATGALARAFGPWQNRVRIPAKSLLPIPASIAPASLILGVLGMPGLTAYAGVKRFLHPCPEETLVVSAAAGPVGATVGQLGKQAGARVIGIAGSEEKCRWLEESAGFAETVNYRQEDIHAGLARTCPKGIDMYFDGVGGELLNAVMEQLALNARIVLCGLMAQYNTDSLPPGPNPGLIIRARASVYGLVVYDHEDLRASMLSELAPRIADGKLAYRECVFTGIDSAAQAFCTLMRGENFGKTIVAL